MKENHQEVEVVDMSGVEQEVYAAREKADEECEEESSRRYEKRSEVRHEEEVDEYINRKFIEGATKGIKSKVTSKKGGKY